MTQDTTQKSAVGILPIPTEPVVQSGVVKGVVLVPSSGSISPGLPLGVALAMMDTTGQDESLVIPGPKGEKGDTGPASVIRESHIPMIHLAVEVAF